MAPSSFKFTYNTPEMAHMLETTVLRIRDHEFLDSRLQDYIRCEPYGRTSFEQQAFKTVWETRQPEWIWEEKQPSPKQNAEYHLVHEAVKKYFHDKGRVRVGTFELPPEVAKKTWTGEQVAGWLYGAEVKELVRKVTGLVPGRRDAFLPQFMKARKSFYNRLDPEDRVVLDSIALRWETKGPPDYVKKKQFQNRFSRVAAAFVSMCLREFGIWVFLFYCGLPGMGIPANIYEALQVKSIARRGLREWAHMEDVLDMIHDYVFEAGAILNNTPDLVKVGRKKTKKDIVTSELYAIDEIEDIVATNASSRLIVRRERISGDLDDAKQCRKILWQMVTCAHNCNTDNPDLQPPWQALSVRSNLQELLHVDCIPGDARVSFGYNLSHTTVGNAKALVEHWIEVGFLEFTKVWRKSEIQDPQPVKERWHMLQDGEEGSDDPDAVSDAGSDDATPARNQIVHPGRGPVFGSKGPLLHLVLQDAAGFTDPIHDHEMPLIEDPPLTSPSPMPPHNPSNPVWTPPCVVPNSAWCRGQYIVQSAKEVRGAEMQAVQNACHALVQCPLDKNYAMPLSAIDQSKGIPSPPPCVRWDSGRAWLADNAEVASIGSYLARRPWTFKIKGATLFCGYSQAWSIVLAALQYARGRAHKEVLLNEPSPNWARSGQDLAQERAKALEYELPARSTISILNDLQTYLEGMTASCQYPGLPPSLLYTRFDTRIEFMRCLLDPIPELTALLKAVIRMPNSQSRGAIIPCVPELLLFLTRGDDIGSLWNWPHCGLPPAVHKRSDGQTCVTDIADWWTDHDLFVDALSQEPLCMEVGLSHLLQAGLLCQELAHFNNDHLDAGDILTNSALRTSSIREDLLSLLVSEARRHTDALLHALDSSACEASDDLVVYSGLEEYDAEPVSMTLTVAQHNQRLLAESVPVDAFGRAVEQMIALDARDTARAQENADTRTRQNKDNRQRTGRIHPARPASTTSAVPDLAFVNDVTLPDVSTVTLPPKAPPKRKAKRPNTTVRRNAPSIPTMRSDHGPSVSGPTRRTTQPTGKKRPAANSSKQAPPRKKRRNNASSSESESEHESFDLDGIDDSDAALGGAFDAPDLAASSRARDAQVRRPRSRSGSQLSFTYVDALQPVAFSPASSSPEPQALEDQVERPRLRPRPRRVQAGRDRSVAAGVSTSFAPFSTAEDTQPATSQTENRTRRGRRSSLRSANSNESHSANRRGARSRSVHFADDTPSARTRSKSR